MKNQKVNILIYLTISAVILFFYFQKQYSDGVIDSLKSQLQEQQIKNKQLQGELDEINKIFLDLRTII